MTPSSVFLVLLHICSLHLIAVAMPTCQLEGNMVQSAHHLLRDLGGPFPARCLPYNANISFPGSAFPAAKANSLQCPRVLWVVDESLEEAGIMFEERELPVAWDNQKVNKFKHLQQRLEEAGSCLPSVDDSGVLSSYFSNVTAVLDQQDSAGCGWMALKRDLVRILEAALHKHRACFSWRPIQHQNHTH
ncbi:interferon phi 3 [Sebastes umbrosus]|uniref:interferon phi 3 n=1 Tax=Sebastes umbrosus TaxID=72105 RepID=UPI0018A01DA9|nr:interferon phi 3 [Sebastes umbrosus]